MVKVTRTNTFDTIRTVLSQKNAHVQYESSSTHSLKVISKVEVLKKWVKLQGQGHKVKYWYPQKGLVTSNIHVNYQSSSTTVQK